MRSRLQELADQIREGEVRKDELTKDHKKILARLEKVNADIQVLDALRKEIFLELSHSEAVLISVERQLQATKNRVCEIVRPLAAGLMGCAKGDNCEY